MNPREHELSVRRTARYYTLGEPGAGVRDVLVACHGYGQLAARFARHFERVASAARLVILPEALSRFYMDDAARELVGASWMTREHRQAEIADYIAYLDAVYEAAAGGLPGARLTALGFSQGAPTVGRWAAFGHHPVSRLILWGGELPPDLDLKSVVGRWSSLEVVMVRGNNDRLITAKVMQGMLSRLHDHGIRHRFVEFEGGHEIDADLLGRLVEDGGGG